MKEAALMRLQLSRLEGCIQPEGQLLQFTHMFSPWRCWRGAQSRSHKSEREMRALIASSSSPAERFDFLRAYVWECARIPHEAESSDATAALTFSQLRAPQDFAARKKHHTGHDDQRGPTEWDCSWVELRFLSDERKANILITSSDFPFRIVSLMDILRHIQRSLRQVNLMEKNWLWAICVPSFF